MRKRKNVVAIYLDEKEKAKLDKNVEISGLIQQTYLLKLIMGHEIKQRMCDHHPKVLNELSSISNDVHRLLPLLTGRGYLTEEEVKGLQRNIADCWSRMRQFL